MYNLSIITILNNKGCNLKNEREFEFDEKFDNGEDISEYLDFSKAKSLENFEKDRLKVRTSITHKYHIPVKFNIIKQIT